MALELVGGAVLGAVFGEFLSAVIKAKQNVEMFRSKLEELEATLELLYPVIKDIDELNKRLNRTSDYERETEMIKRLMEEGKELVCKCFKVERWSLHKKWCYQSKLVKLDNKLLRCHNLHLLANMARDQKETLLAVKKIVVSLNLSPNHRGSSNLTVGVSASSTGPSNQITSLKVIIQVDLDCQKCRTTAMKIAASMCGVSFVGLEGVEKDRLAVIGKGVDSVILAKALRRIFRNAFIVSVQELKVEEHRENLMRSSTIIRGSSMNENDNGDVRNYQNPNILSHSGSIISPALRISEYEDDEMNDNGLCEVLALPPPPSDAADGGTSGGLENEFENMTTQCDDEPLLMQRLHALEATAGKLKFLTPAIVLLSCFNLVISFLIFMYLYK